MISELIPNSYDAVLIAVGHEKFKMMGKKFISTLCKNNHIIFDLKYLFYKNSTSLKTNL